MASLRWRLVYFRHTLGVWGTKSLMRLVWRLPRRIIYLAVIRAWAHATTGNYSGTHPDDLDWSEALKRWDNA